MFVCASQLLGRGFIDKHVRTPVRQHTHTHADDEHRKRVSRHFTRYKSIGLRCVTNVRITNKSIGAFMHTYFTLFVTLVHEYTHRFCGNTPN